jgi:hypothetical protein
MEPSSSLLGEGGEIIQCDSSASENNKVSRLCVGSLIKSADTRRALNVFDVVFSGSKKVFDCLGCCPTFS